MYLNIYLQTNNKRSMKFLETSFEDYLNASKIHNLHPNFKKIFENFPNNINDIHHMIFYGPPGCGKYTQVLNFIKKYSPSELKYEKRIMVTYNKQQYFYKMSDIHYEVDMGLLGCNAKLLWHEIFVQITDSINAKSNKIAIVVCKNFHQIHTELLDIFYSYMQKYTDTQTIKFILVSEHVGFIPSNIIQCSEIVSVPRPTKTNYNKCFHNSLPKNIDLKTITNCKNIQIKMDQIDQNKNICDKIIDQIQDYDKLKFMEFRDNIYDIFIYNLDIAECVWYILETLILNKKIVNNIDNILYKTYSFLKYYNNNYRPIYHLESYLFYLISTIHEIQILP